MNEVSKPIAGAHWFIDETKTAGFTFAVVAIGASEVGAQRAKVKRLVQPGQSALHFNHESGAVKSEAYRLFRTMPIGVTLIHAPKGVKPIVARERAVRGVAQLAKIEHPKRIVFELDEAVDREDRRWLRSELGANSPIEYLHQPRNADPMLWIADGIAWAVQRGGQWRAQVEPLVTKIIEA